MDSAAVWRDGGKSRLRLFLVSSSVAALLVGGSARSAFAQCALNPATNQSAVSNSGAINCINVQGISVAGDVANTGHGVITPTGNTPPTRTGITINNGTVAGRISNAGQIIASHAGAAGIFVTNHATVAGGLANTGSISGAVEGIFLGGTQSAQGISTFGGGINNKGTISAGGSAAILFSYVSSFSGGITNSGTITATGRAISLDSNFTAVGTFDDGISNSGTISSHVDGVFVRVETFTGGLNNSGSVFADIGRGLFVNSVSSFSGGVSNAGTVTSALGTGLEVFFVSRFSGNVVNSGTINAGSNGILVVGTTSFIGDVVNSGTINAASTGVLIASVSSFSGNVSNSGTISAVTGISAVNSSPVKVFDSGVIIGTGGTAVDISGNAVGSSFTLGPGYNITGLVLGQNGDTFQLGGTGSGSFNLSLISTVIAGGCSSSCPQYEGFDNFNVVSGIWTTTGTFNGTQTWNVNGGTLAGTGTFAGINVNSGGTLEPGLVGQPGTFMTLNGNLTFQPGATYLVNIGPTAASRANVSGAVTLNGAVQGFLTPGSYSSKTSYDILDPSSLTGTFTGFTVLNEPGFSGTLSYAANDVMLTLTAQLGAGGGLNVNQQNVAAAVNSYFNNGGTLPAKFFPLFGLTGGALGNSLSQLDGEVGADAAKGAFELTNEFLSLMLDPFVYGRGGSAAGGGPLGFAPDQQASLPPDVALAYAGALKAPPKQTFDQRWTVWGSGFGGSGTSNGDPTMGSSNVTASTYGFAAGADYHVSPDTVLGAAVAGSGTNWNLAQAPGTGRSDAFQAGVYGTKYFGPAYLGAALAFSDHWFTTNRTALGDQLTANFQGQSFGMRVESGYRFAVVPAAGVTPYAAIQAQSFHTPSYSETDPAGGGFGLTYNAMSATDTRSELGGRFDALTAWSGVPVQLRARVAWAHDWVNAPALGASFLALPGTSFVVNGAPLPRDSALTSIGAELHLTSRWTLIGKFDGAFAPSAHTYAGSGTLRYTW